LPRAARFVCLIKCSWPWDEQRSFTLFHPAAAAIDTTYICAYVLYIYIHLTLLRPLLRLRVTTSSTSPPPLTQTHYSPVTRNGWNSFETPFIYIYIYIYVSIISTRKEHCTSKLIFPLLYPTFNILSEKFRTCDITPRLYRSVFSTSCRYNNYIYILIYYSLESTYTRWWIWETNVGIMHIVHAV